MHQSANKKKADAAAVLTNDQSNLFRAHRDGANETYTSLVNQGTVVNVTVQDPETLDFMTPLIIACENAVELLMHCGADVELLDVTPLHWACLNQQPDAVETFLHQGADIDIVDPRGKTALQEALYGHSSSMSNRVATLQHLATCSQTRLEASSADWIRLARNERNRPQMTLGSMGTARQRRRRKSS